MDIASGMSGRVALVTGGGKNLGRAVALAAATRGAAVGVNVLSDEAAAVEVVDRIRSAGGRATAIVGDVSDPSGAREIVGRCRTDLGPVEIFVHCAAYRTAHVAASEIEPADWERVVAVALDGAFLCLTEVIPDMLAASFGRVVLIGGSALYLGLPEGSTHGGAAKAGLVGVARAIAQEYGSRGITANVVSPGAMNTERTRNLTFEHGWSPIAASTIQRLVELDEVAGLCMDLCETRAAIVNGQTILADGGMTAGPSGSSST